jgi:hypothetical protein
MAKRPTTASLKKVTAENLANLGVARLAEILADAAESRPDLKRRLRMELAAEQGADHFVVEIDKRLATLEMSRGKISWRQRPAFVRDLDGLRRLIGERLATLDRLAAFNRLLTFLGLARRVGGRVRDRDGSLALVFDQAARDLGPVLAELDATRAAEGLVEAIAQSPALWEIRLPVVLETTTPDLARAMLRRLNDRRGAVPGSIALIRQLADAAGDPDAYQATFTHKELLDPSAAAEVAGRMLAADRVAEAAALLEGARPKPSPERRRPFLAEKAAEPDFDWETAWIEVLERTGRGDEAQAARWGSFERTLSATRLRAFTRLLADFEDVEAEGRAFAQAADHPDVQRALQFLMDWPALGEAARLIETRADDLAVADEDAELWAMKLQGRYPAAAHTLLRRTAAAAFRRRDFATCDRLTAEADEIDL